MGGYCEWGPTVRVRRGKVQLQACRECWRSPIGERGIWSPSNLLRRGERTGREGSEGVKRDIESTWSIPMGGGQGVLAEASAARGLLRGHKGMGGGQIGHDGNGDTGTTGCCSDGNVELDELERGLVALLDLLDLLAAGEAGKLGLAGGWQGSEPPRQPLPAPWARPHPQTPPPQKTTLQSHPPGQETHKAGLQCLDVLARAAMRAGGGRGHGAAEGRSRAVT
jgi:hypothetical protein